MGQMADGIVLERVTAEDLDGIVGLAAAAWYSPDGLGDLAAGALDEAGLTGPERDHAARLLATDEVSSYLASATWGMKALLNGQVVGVVLTQGTHGDAEARKRWEDVGRQARETAEQLLARARERNEHAAEPGEPVYLDEVRATGEMRAQAGLDGQPRVLLLVISEAARGHGLGRRLLAQARDHFSRHGASRYWLVTDTDCDWPFYEHLGLERLAERAGAVKGAPERYFVYGGRA